MGRGEGKLQLDLLEGGKGLLCLELDPVASGCSPQCPWAASLRPGFPALNPGAVL